VILVVPRVLSREELTTVRAGLEGARFGNGHETAGAQAREQKHVLQLERAGDGQREVGELIVRALLRHPMLQAAALPKSLRHPTLNRYEPGMYYGPHLDVPIMRGSLAMRADVSVTVFLSEPSDYTGGELLIAADQTPVAIKAAAGDAHHLVNRGSRDVVYLEIGDRTEGEEVVYPDDDLLLTIGPDGKYRSTRKDGTPFT